VPKLVAAKALDLGEITTPAFTASAGSDKGHVTGVLSGS